MKGSITEKQIITPFHLRHGLFWV